MKHKNSIFIISGGMDSIIFLYDIAKVGKVLGIDYSKIYSCYKGGEKHCGKCGTCVERKEALRDAGIDDPTEYEE